MGTEVSGVRHRVREVTGVRHRVREVTGVRHRVREATGGDWCQPELQEGKESHT